MTAPTVVNPVAEAEGAYLAMIKRAAAALTFESAAGFTPAEARVLAEIVYDATLNDLAGLVDDHGALYDRNADWRDGVEEAAQVIRTLASPSGAS